MKAIDAMSVYDAESSAGFAPDAPIGAIIRAISPRGAIPQPMANVSFHEKPQSFAGRPQPAIFPKIASSEITSSWKIILGDGGHTRQQPEGNKEYRGENNAEWK